jgi:hypothetical protein
MPHAPSLFRTRCLALGLIAAVAGAAVGQAPPSPASPPRATPRDLLGLAFEAASLLPTEPHRKNRSRIQESVVVACLQLGEVEMAHGFAQRIDDWRRGTCFADIAIFQIEHGRIPQAKPLLDEAAAVAGRAVDDPQGWRADRIESKLARANLLLGDEEAARTHARGIGAADLGDFESQLARTAAVNDFAAELAKLDAIFASGSFEPIRNALSVCVQWYDRFFTDDDRRQAAARRVATAYDKLPAGVRIDLLAELAAIALRHGDAAEAKRQLDAATGSIQPAAWLLEDELQIRGRLLLLRARAGDLDGARSGVADAVARFYAGRERIVDIYRASALRPLAAVCVQLGDQREAARLFRAAVEEGRQNPNGRPRAEDLAATCCAMAVAGYEPDAALLARLDDIKKGLGNPW